MIARNARLILITDISIVLSNIVSSLIGARVLGPAGRGDLLVVVLWPPIIAMIAGLGLPNAYRYQMAKTPERVSPLFANAVIYTLVVGVIAVVLADLIVPHLIGDRSAEVRMLVRIYQINIPAALLLDLMRGLLEGTRRFGWAGLSRSIFFGVQTIGFTCLWLAGALTVKSAMLVMIVAQAGSMLMALVAVFRELQPRWQPAWSEFKDSMSYGVRDYPGNVADYATLRLDQLMLGAMASNVAIGLYVVAVRLSEVTTMAADAIASALMPEVAARKAGKSAETLWARSFRLAIYMHVAMLPVMWLAAPLLLKLLFGQSFVPATSALRWLLVAAAVWSLGSIVVSGLRGFGYPGLSTVARFSAAVVTGVALVILLPRYGITGAAIASLLGYSVMLLMALGGFIHRRQIRLWDCLRPQRRDIPLESFRSLRAFAFWRPSEEAPRTL